MKEVVLHVYDVTNSDSDKTNSTILHINKIFKDGIGIGGIFHSAVQETPARWLLLLRRRRRGRWRRNRLMVVITQKTECIHFSYQVYESEEWSFGFCEYGSGVFSCPPTRNPMYTYRESIVLGRTNCTNSKVHQILRQLSRDWPGCSYDLLAKNCNHFCDDFCERLGVQKLPAWVNRFANAGDAALEVAENTAIRLKQAKDEIVTASKVAYRFLAGVTSKSPTAPEGPSNPSSRVPRFQGTWLGNLIPEGDQPSSSTFPVDSSSDDELPMERQNSLARLPMEWPRSPDQLSLERHNSFVRLPPEWPKSPDQLVLERTISLDQLPLRRQKSSDQLTTRRPKSSDQP